jgi:hypothetical protein
MAIDGTWYNELNSSVNVQLNGNVISGIYHNEAGQAKGDYNFSGLVEPSPLDSNQAVSWVVTWVRLGDNKNFHSVTAWSGQYQLVNNPQTGQPMEVISAEWLLTSETTPDADWASTNIGHDVFTRTPPSSAAVVARLKMSAWSHPRKEIQKG